MFFKSVALISLSLFAGINAANAETNMSAQGIVVECGELSNALGSLATSEPGISYLNITVEDSTLSLNGLRVGPFSKPQFFNSREPADSLSVVSTPDSADSTREIYSFSYKLAENSVTGLDLAEQPSLVTIWFDGNRNQWVVTIEASDGGALLRTTPNCNVDTSALLGLSAKR